jgi:hypothetical protein
MVLVYEKTGKVVKVGDRARTFRGERVVVVGMYVPHKPGSSGRVRVRFVKDGWEQSFYPFVIGAKWTPGLRAVDGLGALDIGTAEVGLRLAQQALARGDRATAGTVLARVRLALRSTEVGRLGADETGHLRQALLEAYYALLDRT